MCLAALRPQGVGAPGQSLPVTPTPPHRFIKSCAAKCLKPHFADPWGFSEFSFAFFSPLPGGTTDRSSSACKRTRREQGRDWGFINTRSPLMGSFRSFSSRRQSSSSAILLRDRLSFLIPGPIPYVLDRLQGQKGSWATHHVVRDFSPPSSRTACSQASAN